MYQKNPLRIYSQILDCPFPIELSTYNTCSHRCDYCFIQNNREHYKKKRSGVEKYCFDNTNSVITKFAKAMSGMYNPKDPMEYFIRNKYPVVYSNTTDPFCSLEFKSRSAEKLLCMFADYQYPVFIQTKNPYIEEYLPIMEANKENMIIYVTLCGLDDNKNNMFESGTPLPSERIKKIEKLVDLGFDVVVALNPYIDGWSTPVDEYVKFVSGLGVMGIWFDYLHLSRTQKTQIRAKGKEELIQYSEIGNSRKLSVFKDFVAACKKYDLEYETNAWFSDKCEYFDDLPYLNTRFENVFTLSTPFLRKELDSLWVEHGKKPMIITWKSFLNMIDCDILHNVFTTHKIFAALNNTIRMSQPQFNSTIGKENTLANILRYTWNGWGEINNWVWSIPGVNILATKDEKIKGRYTVEDEENNTVMVYHRPDTENRDRIFYLEDYEGETIELT